MVTRGDSWKQWLTELFTVRSRREIRLDCTGTEFGFFEGLSGKYLVEGALKMWIHLKGDADLNNVQAELSHLGLWTRALKGQANTMALEVLSHSQDVETHKVVDIDGVADVLIGSSPHPLVDAKRGCQVVAGGVPFGQEARPVLMAGPCSVESEEQIMEAAAEASAAGAQFLRGGAFKPRTSPYAFSGHGRPALQWIREAADTHWLSVVTEVMSERDVEEVAKVADLIQIGSRNMQNFALLKAVGQTGKPVMLKRGLSATIHEWMMAGEHLLAAGAGGVVYCERGVQGFDPSTRNMVDLGAVALMRHVFKLPVVVDPSHAVGRRDLIPHIARAALAAGANGILVELHLNPRQAQCDGPQAIDGAKLAEINTMGFS
jgi:3-deoxy-7-phosphoheptulonate synthase